MKVAVKPVEYPTVPDLSIKVGDRVRSFDFGGNAECYFVGLVEEIKNQQCKVKVEFQVWEAKRVPDSQNYCSYVLPPMNGLRGMFGLTRGVQRMEEGEEL